MGEIVEGRGIGASETQAPLLANNISDRRTDRSGVADSMSYLSSMDSSSDLPTLERSRSSREDPAAMTIEFLRARLLSERSVSKVARQQAHQLERKALHLERQLELEIELRKKAEAVRLESITKLSEGLAESNESILSNSGEDDYNKQNNGDCENDCNGAKSNIDCNDLQQTLVVTEVDKISTQPTLADNLHHSEENSESQSACHRPGSLTWDTQRGSRNKQDKVLFPNHKRSQSLTLPATLTDRESGYKHQIGKSVRQKRKSEVSRTEKDAANFESSKKDTRTSDQLKYVDQILNVEQNVEARQPSGWSMNIEKHEESCSKLDGRIGSDLLLLESQQVGFSDMEKALEHQAKFISKHEAEEQAQKEWEENYTKEHSPNTGEVGQTIAETSGSDEEAPGSVPSETLSREIFDDLVAKTRDCPLWKNEQQLQKECCLSLTAEKLMCNRDSYKSGSVEVCASVHLHNVGVADQDKPPDNKNLPSFDVLQEYLHKEKSEGKKCMKAEDNNFSDRCFNDLNSTELHVDFHNNCSIVSEYSCECNSQDKKLPDEKSDVLEDSSGYLERLDASAQYPMEKENELKLGFLGFKSAEPVSDCSTEPEIYIGGIDNGTFSSSFKFIACPDNSSRQNDGSMNDAAVMEGSEASKTLNSTAASMKLHIPEIHNIPTGVGSSNNYVGGGNIDLAVNGLLVDESNTSARKSKFMDQVVKPCSTVQYNNQAHLPVKQISHDHFNSTQIPPIVNLPFNQQKKVVISDMMGQVEQKAVANLCSEYLSSVENGKEQEPAFVDLLADHHVHARSCEDAYAKHRDVLRTREQNAAVGRSDSCLRNLGQKFPEPVMMQDFTENTSLDQVDDLTNGSSWDKLFMTARHCYPAQSGGNLYSSQQLVYAASLGDRKKFPFSNITCPNLNLQNHESRLALQCQPMDLQEVPVDAGYERAMRMLSALKMAKQLMQAEGVARPYALETGGNMMVHSRVSMEPHAYVVPSPHCPVARACASRLINHIPNSVNGSGPSWPESEGKNQSNSIYRH